LYLIQEKEMKTSELQGAALDWAVAECEGQEVVFEDGELCLPSSYFKDGDPYTPSTDWAQGGPIIERERICIGSGMDAPTWYANEGLGKYHQFGPTPLIAAMRCYVASKLGDEVKVPNEVEGAQS
jgi:hypothetical protein